MDKSDALILNTYKYNYLVEFIFHCIWSPYIYIEIYIYITLTFIYIKNEKYIFENKILYVIY